MCLANDSTNADAQLLCVDAKVDFNNVPAEDANNREARAELAKVCEFHKRLRREELSKEKESFSFASTLAACRAEFQRKGRLGPGIRQQDCRGVGPAMISLAFGGERFVDVRTECWSRGRPDRILRLDLFPWLRRPHHLPSCPRLET